MTKYFMILIIPIFLFSCKKDIENTKQFRSIGSGMAHNLILQQDGNSNFVILDVRTADEYNHGHIEDAINIDYLNNKEDLLTLNKQYTYLIYCESGRRSLLAAEYMNQFDFKSLFNMSGGIKEWKAMFNTLIPSPYNEAN
jgi:rhodanese-related sulfurtransferase